MSLNYELFVELHRKKYKTLTDIEIDMVNTAKEKYNAEIKNNLEKEDISNIRVFSYLENELIKENTIKFMAFCEDSFKTAYKSNIYKKFLDDFKSFSNSNKEYIKYFNKENNTNFQLDTFKNTDFLRLTEIFFRTLHSIYIKESASSTGMKLNSLRNVIVKNIKDEIYFNDIYNEYKNLILKKIDQNKFSSYEHFRTSVIFTLNKIGVVKETEYSNEDLCKIITVFLEFFLDNCSNLFKVSKTRVNKKEVKYVYFSDEYLEKTNKLLDRFGDSFIDYKPMIQKPKPWTNLFDGGYYSQKLHLVKTNKKENCFINDNFEIKETLEAVNILQDVDYKINKNIHEVMYNLFNNSKNKFFISNKAIPSATIDFESIERHKILDADFDSLSDNDKKKYKEEKKKYKDRKFELHLFEKSTNSKRMLMNTVLKLAAEFYDHKIYFPYQVDTRDRFYPVSKFLNPQGNDYAKGLLELGTGRKLTEESIEEYKKHIANVFAFDKIDKKSEEEKVVWVDNNKEMLLSFAENPYKNVGWTNADKPWQALAACFEFEKICKFGTNYISYAYCDIDASNNGLQHYASILLDLKMSKLTNLADNYKNEDCYEYIADKVKNFIKENHNNFTVKQLENIRKIEKYGINRKLIKRPVMTVSYSATVQGWTNQIISVIREYINNGHENYFNGKSDLYSSVFYFCNEILKPVAEDELRGAFDAMNVIKKHVYRIHDVKKDADFMYFNPSKFLVKNNYKKKESVKISYRFLRQNKSIYFNRDTKINDIKKVINAICPNFIHSIDASHMSKVLVESKKNGIDKFVMVHDSFGCHPNDINLIKKIVKEQFVKIHSRNNLYFFLKDLYEFNMIEFDNDELLNDCKRGSFDLNEVLKSKFGFC